MSRVGGDVTLREDPRIGGRVDRPDLRSAALELLRDARRSRKEVDCGPRSGAGEELAEHRNESPLRAQVLDHRPIIRGGRRRLKHSRQRKVSVSVLMVERPSKWWTPRGARSPRLTQGADRGSSAPRGGRRLAPVEPLALIRNDPVDT